MALNERIIDKVSLKIYTVSLFGVFASLIWKFLILFPMRTATSGGHGGRASDCMRTSGQASYHLSGRGNKCYGHRRLATRAR